MIHYSKFLLFTFFIACNTNKKILKWTENDYNNKYAKIINGKREIKKYYRVNNKQYYIIIDIETKTEVIEGGKDKRTSLDSIQQALFFSYLTKKKPIVVIYDTDNKFGQYEYRIQESCNKAGVEFRNIKLKKN